MDPRSGRTCRVSPSLSICPRISQLNIELFEIVSQVLVDRQLRELLENGTVDPRSLSNWAQLGHRPPRHGDRELLTSLCPAEDLADLVAELFLRDLGHAPQGSNSATWNPLGRARRGIRHAREAVTCVPKGSAQGSSPPSTAWAFPHRGACPFRAGGRADAGGAGGGGAGGRFRASAGGGRAGGGRCRSLSGYGWSCTARGDADGRQEPGSSPGGAGDRCRAGAGDRGDGGARGRL